VPSLIGIFIGQKDYFDVSLSHFWILSNFCPSLHRLHVAACTSASQPLKL